MISYNPSRVLGVITDGRAAEASLLDHRGQNRPGLTFVSLKVRIVASVVRCTKFFILRQATVILRRHTLHDTHG